MNLTKRETPLLIPEPYWSAFTTGLRALHFCNRTGVTCYGPLAQNIQGVDERANIASVRHVLTACGLFINRWCQREPL